MNPRYKFTFFSLDRSRMIAPSFIDSLLSWTPYTAYCTAQRWHTVYPHLPLQSHSWPEPQGASNRTSNQYVDGNLTIQKAPRHFSRVDSSQKKSFFQSDYLKYTKVHTLMGKIYGYCLIMFMMSHEKNMVYPSLCIWNMKYSSEYCRYPSQGERIWWGYCSEDALLER